MMILLSMMMTTPTSNKDLKTTPIIIAITTITIYVLILKATMITTRMAM